MSGSPSHRRLGIALAPAIVVILALAFGRKDAPRAVATPDTGEDPAPGPTSATPSLPPPRGPSRAVPSSPGAAASAPAPAPPMTEAEARAQALDHARRSLETYEQTLVYPPWSRPLDGTTQHLLDWNKPFPEGQSFAADKDRREIRADATLDKLFAGPGDTLSAQLTVAYAPDAEGGAGDPVHADAVSGEVQVYDATAEAWQPAGAVAFTEGDPGKYTASFTPSTLPALRKAPREARFVTRVAYGEFTKDIPQTFQYAADQVFSVKDVAFDRIGSDGSLEITLDVDVKVAAPTLVEAVLFDAEGKRGIAVYDDYYRPSWTGRARMTITFFGKVLRDAGVDGPYSLRALHGHVKEPGADPPEVFWSRPDSAPPLLTHAYTASTFSDSAWSSPEKDAKVQLYQQTIAELQAPH